MTELTVQSVGRAAFNRWFLISAILRCKQHIYTHLANRLVGTIDKVVEQRPFSDRVFKLPRISDVSNR